MLTAMKPLLLAAAVITVSAEPGSRRALWRAFKRDHGKTYWPLEELRRYRIFKANLDFIEAHNAKGLSYHLGIGPFADLTNDEYKARLSSPERAYDALHNNNPTEWSLAAAQNLPRSIDWVKTGAVTDVKNQGQCGDCWAFSATGALEGLEFVKTQRKPVPLSEQQLVDCTGPSEGGCGGGTMSGAFDYAKAHGLCNESDYPYISGKDPHTKESCVASKCTSALAAGAFTSVVNVPGTEAALAAAVVNQPISIAIEADKPEFQHYKGGVFNSPNCGNKLDHGVLLVGYGEVGNQSCDAQSSRVCTTEQTCCPLSPSNPRGKWGCCPLENAKCCPAVNPGDQQNCCPDNMVCYQCPGPKCGCVTSEEYDFLKAMKGTSTSSVRHFPVSAGEKTPEEPQKMDDTCTPASSIRKATCFAQDPGDKATVTITHQKDSVLTPEMCSQYCEANSSCLAWSVVPSTVPAPLKTYQGCFLVSGTWDGYRSACPYEGDSSGCSTRGIAKNPAECCPKGPADTKKFWQVKNSWGTTWGADGYIKIMKDTGGVGLCGLAMNPSYPVAKSAAEIVV